MLHITNGESVVSSFRQVRFPGAYLPWNDVLHDGPVPQTSSLGELSDVRAQALAGFGWGELESLRAQFADRERRLTDFRKQDEVVLWFDHDLFDQLQLIQLLSWFSQQQLGKVRLSIVQINSYPGVQNFYGLGQLSGTQLSRLFPVRRTVSPEQLAIGHDAWQAFCAATPQELLEFSQANHPEMPFLQAALLRLLQEYPWTTDGLARSQRQLLLAVQSGSATKQQIYIESRKLEAVPWGDSSIYLRLDGLASGPKPALVRNEDKSYALTSHGKDVLAGKADWVKLNGGIDVWIGGVHLMGTEAEWRWDEDRRTLVRSF